MKITDATGKELTRDEVIASGRGHLLPDAVHGICNECGRKSWGNLPGDRCGMPQPDRRICTGVFINPA